MQTEQTKNNVIQLKQFMTNELDEQPCDVPLNKKDNNGGGGGSMETRIATLEADVRHIRTDISEMKTGVREIRDEIKETRLDIHREVNKMMVFTTTIVIASMAIMAAIFAYIVK